MKVTDSSYFKSIHENVVGILPPIDLNGSIYNLNSPILSKNFSYHKEIPITISKDLFGHAKHKTFVPETTVFNMVVCDHRPYKTSATQATASMNKCLQVYSKGNRPLIEKANASLGNSKNLIDKLTNPEVHFINVFKTTCGKSNRCDNKRCPKRSSSKHSSDEASDSTQSKPSHVQSTGTSTRAVVIDQKGCIPSNCEEKRRENAKQASVTCCVEPCVPSPCPPSGGVTVYGANDKTVKVTTCGNSRRGVFELVVRRLTGAPLGKNELMLEWTPPPSGPPCSSPCCARCPPYPCSPCPPVKPCKPARVSRLVICPLPHTTKCRPCCKRSCVRPCKKPCCKPKPKCCGPVSRCGTCPKGPCPSCPPCGRPCGAPCGSIPCFRSCPVARRRPRRCRSQPRIRSHPKRDSPCHNRAPSCPAVRCSRPCVSCCALPYPPRLSCSTVRSGRSRSLKSGCSTCCP